MRNSQKDNIERYDNVNVLDVNNAQSYASLNASIASFFFSIHNYVCTFCGCGTMVASILKICFCFFFQFRCFAHFIGLQFIYVFLTWYSFQGFSGSSIIIMTEILCILEWQWFIVFSYVYILFRYIHNPLLVLHV